jgi:hypothetical protein
LKIIASIRDIEKKTLAIYVRNICNIEIKHLQHTSEKTNKTLGTCACNIRVQPLQHMQHPPKHLKHRLTTCVKTPETLKHSIVGGHDLHSGELQWPASSDQEDVGNNSPTYTSTAGHPFLSWCLRLAAGDNVKAGDGLLLVASGWWWPGDATVATGEMEWGAAGDERAARWGEAHGAVG